MLLPVRHVRVLRGIIHDGLQGTAGEGSAGNGIHAGAVRFDHFRDHDVESAAAHMGGFHGGRNLDRFDLALGVCYVAYF